ncbi:diguanylate cyclase [Acidihalobacter aeolianus]|uniref:diguanylate cyclase n=1 Tax=Acidihalobacter aeolianus TaxID=2792603 RepID=A0A1D8KBW3_9GAMM|nr:sensor domain-containing diguanylate cyclase [Acidihalobacter aeolianus]AOV18444.1 diguanylate cyclase [Acidihalobacter aeolianus]
MSDKEYDADSVDAVHKTLLESTKAIPWKIDWDTMTFAYIGPQIEPLLGWTQESWVTAEDWAMRIHPDDRDYVVNFCISQSKEGIDHEADYRALTKDNGYVWIRDVVHVVRKENGDVEALVGFMFDISERKKAEEELIRLQAELEALSFMDGLTGIANRRRLDAALETEWASARRSGTPLSLVMLDVDYFKQYNDRYGHGQGDTCLKDVAETLQAAAARPRDVLARFGGEEFALLLPETDADAAKAIAERCIRLIAAREIPHEASRIGPLVTVSIGVGTTHTFTEDEPRRFVDFVDGLLYQAKHNGRNRIESGTM